MKSSTDIKIIIIIILVVTLTGLTIYTVVNSNKDNYSKKDSLKNIDFSKKIKSIVESNKTVNLKNLNIPDDWQGFFKQQYLSMTIFMVRSTVFSWYSNLEIDSDCVANTIMSSTTYDEFVRLTSTIMNTYLVVTPFIVACITGGLPIKNNF